MMFSIPYSYPGPIIRQREYRQTVIAIAFSTGLRMQKFFYGFAGPRARRTFHATLKRIVAAAVTAAGTVAVVAHRLFSTIRPLYRSRNSEEPYTPYYSFAYCRYLSLIYRQSLAKASYSILLFLLLLLLLSPSSVSSSSTQGHTGTYHSWLVYRFTEKIRALRQVPIRWENKIRIICTLQFIFTKYRINSLCFSCRVNRNVFFVSWNYREMYFIVILINCKSISLLTDLFSCRFYCQLMSVQ